MKEAVYEKYQEEIVIEAIDLEDPETLALFAAGGYQGDFPIWTGWSHSPLETEWDPIISKK